jgi:hypothetical protein
LDNESLSPLTVHTSCMRFIDYYVRTELFGKVAKLCQWREISIH